MSAFERRLRAALDARARSVTAADLSPAVPPTAMPLRRRHPAMRWRLGAVTVGVTIALAAVGVAVFPVGDDGRGPAPNAPHAPAGPGSVEPRPSGSPGPSGVPTSPGPSGVSGSLEPSGPSGSPGPSGLPDPPPLTGQPTPSVGGFVTGDPENVSPTTSP
ncbi:hypothetical protein EDD30_1888 [Couchioplanes caeruleus]|uniref:Uncharacterized protein n=1 Tax=Couchioplanes caeruleus TaxID=56438 RepID=A0A3N1GFT5_9ACTN|nr:hypothetical protein EDD30_1888 [Couchioplanes caeruleus]